MIANVTGVVSAVGATWAVVTVGGMGLRLLCTPSTCASLRTGQETTLATSLVVREDSLTLYGFADDSGREMFELVQTSTGVGPKLALAILSVHTPNMLRRCLADDDLDALMLVPGVGKRTAQRLLVDLKARLEVPDLDLVEATGGTSTPRSEVRDALIGLGYSPEEVRTVLGQIGEEGTVETMLRDALRVLAGSR